MKGTFAPASTLAQSSARDVCSDGPRNCRTPSSSAATAARASFMDWPPFVRKRCMTEEKEGKTEKLSMLLIIIVTIIIIITIMNHRNSTDHDVKGSALLSQIGPKLEGMCAVLVPACSGS